jgi:peptidoglycan hydrolase-like protein with peptidoglycan-binding domain
MFDDVNVDLLPQADAYAAYADGIYANVGKVRAKFPHAHILTIAVKASDLADALDIEAGDAVNSDAPGWFKRVLASGVAKPCLYTSVSNADVLVNEMTKANIPRTAYRLWTAHYGKGEHLCGPTTCGGSSATADATQFTSRAKNENLDESVCLADFFTMVLPPPPVTHPVLTMGDRDSAPNGPVHTLQTRLDVWGFTVVIDGIFGQATAQHVVAFQAKKGLTPDGVVGPQTWAAILKNPPLVQFAAPTSLRSEVGIISISWDAVGPSQGKEPNGYTVSVKDDGALVKAINVKGTTAVVDGLTRNKIYDISVYADGGQAAPGSANITVTA